MNGKELYGEITKNSIANIIDVFQSHGFDSNSKFVDIGHNFGKIVFHVTVFTQSYSIGVELDHDRAIHS